MVCEPLYELGKLIAVRRAQFMLSAVQLARLAEIEVSTVVQLEAGTLTDMSWGEAQAVLRVVGLNLDGLQETLHLLNTPANADRLCESVAEFKVGTTFIKEVRIHEAGEGKKAKPQR